MAYINLVIIQGHLVRKPEYKVLTSSELVTFDIAVDTGYGEKQEVSFIPIVYFSKNAEEQSKMEKGDLVWVSGKIRQESFVNKQGEKRTLLKVYANLVQKLREPFTHGKPEPRKQENPQQATQPQSDEEPDMFEKNPNEAGNDNADIPF